MSDCKVKICIALIAIVGIVGCMVIGYNVLTLSKDYYRYEGKLEFIQESQVALQNTEVQGVAENFSDSELMTKNAVSMQQYLEHEENNYKSKATTTLYIIAIVLIAAMVIIEVIKEIAVSIPI